MLLIDELDQMAFIARVGPVRVTVVNAGQRVLKD